MAIILARYPAPETSLVGKPFLEKAPFNTFLVQTKGVLEAVGPKGILVLYVFTSTRSALVAGDVINILSVPKQDLLPKQTAVSPRT